MTLAFSYVPPVSLPPTEPRILPRDAASWAAHVASLQQWAQLLQSAGFIEATLLNGWANVGGTLAPAGFRADLTGRIYLRGVLAGNANSLPSTIFQLPWAPQWHQMLTAGAKDSTPAYTSAQVDIDRSGNVILEALQSGSWGAGGMLSLDGLSLSLAP